MINATLGEIERGGGGGAMAHRRKWRDLNANVTVLKNELSGERTLDEYWLSIGSVCAKMKLKFLI